MTAPIAVTGATGQLGGLIAAALSAAGVQQRLLVRSPSRAPVLPATEVVTAEYADRAAVKAALAGVGTVFMVSGAEEPDRLTTHRTFVDAAVEAGVGRIVYTSFFAAAPDATFTLARDHWHTEQHIRASGLRFTFLRDNFYAEQFAQFAGVDGVLLGPGGDGRVSAVARRDVADAAVAVLLDASDSAGTSVHDGRTYDLTGPESLSLAEVARILSETTGRDVRYQAETVDEAYASRAGYRATGWQVDAWVSTYTAIAAGELARVTHDVELLTGHPATSLARLLAAG
ncbi:MAG TPA: SDR family oxidoreductase [Nakamurella sp.]